MTAASAWLIPITSNHSVAVGEFELVHILPDQPVLFNVPRAPTYCRQVLVWQDRIIPVLDLSKRFRFVDDTLLPFDNTTTALVGICIYQSEHTKHVEYGALLMHDTPVHGEVDDKQVCDIDTDLSAWRYFMSSCFRIENTQQIVPVLRLERLFAPLNTMAT
jgi:chemotaxis signal transduction protein